MTESFERIAPDATVLTPQALQLWCDAHEAYRSAVRDADELMQAAQAAHDTEKQRGFAEGMVAARVEMADRVLATAADAAQVLRNLEISLPEIVADIVEDMLGRVDLSQILPLAIEHGLTRIRRGATAQLRIAPDCVAVLQEMIPLLNEREAGLRVEIDASLASGRCVLESEFGIAELGIADQIRLLRERLAAQWQNLPDLASDPVSTV